MSSIIFSFTPRERACEILRACSACSATPRAAALARARALARFILILSRSCRLTSFFLSSLIIFATRGQREGGERVPRPFVPARREASASRAASSSPDDRRVSARASAQNVRGSRFAIRHRRTSRITYVADDDDDARCAVRHNCSLRM